MTEQKILVGGDKQQDEVSKTDTPVKQHKGLYIGGSNQQVKRDFVKLAQDKKITYGEMLAIMLNNYQNLRLDFNETETGVMQEVRAISPSVFDKRIKKIILRYAKNLINLKDRPESAIDLKVKNSPKAADTRANDLIEQIFQHNNNVINWYDKILLTKSSILDYAATQKTLNKTISMGKVVLERCLERNQEAIDQHHIEHQLTPNHNAIAYYERLKATKRDKS